MSSGTRKLAAIAMAAGSLLAIGSAPTQAAAVVTDADAIYTPASDYIFCGTLSGSWSTSTKGRTGTVTIGGTCELKPVSWQLDMYVNGEFWARSQGSTTKTGYHAIKVYAPSMPRPNDKRGNYTWVKVTYKYGKWTNVYEQEIGWLACTGCTS